MPPYYLGTQPMAKTHTPLTHLLDEIEYAANYSFPMLAIGMAVALPDICVSLTSQRPTHETYISWCRENLPQEFFGYIAPEDLYSMRCGVLHNGKCENAEI